MPGPGNLREIGCPKRELKGLRDWNKRAILDCALDFVNLPRHLVVSGLCELATFDQKLLRLPSVLDHFEREMATFVEFLAELDQAASD